MILLITTLLIPTAIVAAIVLLIAWCLVAAALARRIGAGGQFALLAWVIQVWWVIFLFVVAVWLPATFFG